MKKLSILFTAIILSSHAFSQLNYSWVKTLKLIEINGIESSGSGNVFIMGKFTATTDFDPSSASFFLTPNVTKSCYLAKYTSTGNFIWAKEIISEVNIASATSDLRVSDLVIDASENVYITGTYDHIVDFDPSSTTYTLSTIDPISSLSENAFTVKYSSSGSLVWVKDIKRGYGLLNSTKGIKIELDNSNNVYVGGQVSNRPFFCKYTNAGNMMWKDSLITSGGDPNSLQGMYVNGAGEVFIGGVFVTDIDMDPNAGVNLLSSSSSFFIGKYTTSGTILWAKKIPGSYSYGKMRDITADALGNVYTCGVDYFLGVGYKNQMTKWDISGNLQWNNFFNIQLYPGNGCADIFLGCNNQIIVTGNLNTTLSGPQNFDPLGGVYVVNTMLNFVGTFIAAYSPSNGAISWAKCVGGDGSTSGSYIDNSGSVYLSGSTSGSGSNDFDPGSGIVSVNIPASTANVFFAKYTGCGAVGLEENNDTYNISVSPNPSNDEFIFSNLIGENKIEVIDITGRLILIDEIKYSSYTLRMDNLPKGMYFYKIIDAKGQLKQGKLLLQ